MTSKPTPASPTTTTVEPPEDLASTLHVAGFAAELLVRRLDGAPLSAADRTLLATVLEGYALGRASNPTDEEITDAVRDYIADEKATGTGGE